MKARVQWLDGRAFVGESGSSHAVVMDGSPEAGGRTPSDFPLAGLTQAVLDRSGWPAVSPSATPAEPARHSDSGPFAGITLRLTGGSYS
jgi:putative redox protein